MSDLHWTFLVLGLATWFAQRSANGSSGWRAWLGAGSILAAGGVIALTLDATGTSPNFAWIGIIPIGLAAVAQQFIWQAKGPPVP